MSHGSVFFDRDFQNQSDFSSFARHRNLAHMMLSCSICSPCLKALLILFFNYNPRGTHQSQLKKSFHNDGTTGGTANVIDSEFTRYHLETTGILIQINSLVKIIANVLLTKRFIFLSYLFPTGCNPVQTGCTGCNPVGNE